MGPIVEKQIAASAVSADSIQKYQKYANISERNTDPNLNFYQEKYLKYKNKYLQIKK
jgi:hypothetical protein